MLALAPAAGDYNAIERVLGIKTNELSEERHASIRRAYAPVLAATVPPEDVGPSFRPTSSSPTRATGTSLTS
jgi:hypothetical protein